MKSVPRPEFGNGRAGGVADDDCGVARMKDESAGSLFVLGL
jgi:hypothetical protein